MKRLPLLFLLLTTTVQAAEFRFAQDSWTGSDKLDHALGGAVTMLAVSGLTHDADVSLKYSVLFWALWEIKDALVRWEDAGYWGGDGFSYKDLAWSTAGVLAVYTIIKVLT